MRKFYWNRSRSPFTDTKHFHAVVYLTYEGDYAWVVTPVLKRPKGSRCFIPPPAAFGRVATEAEGIEAAENFMRNPKVQTERTHCPPNQQRR